MNSLGLQLREGFDEGNGGGGGKGGGGHPAWTMRVAGEGALGQSGLEYWALGDRW